MAAVATVSAGDMNRRTWRRRASDAQDATLVVLAAFFFYVHANHTIQDGSVTSIFFASEQALLVGMFLLRRRSNSTSPRIADWVFATVGGWLPLALQPHDGMPGGAIYFGTGMQMAGLTLTCYGFMSLGRSFGIVAANRGLKQHGPYRLVRHPIYLSHAITMTGFLVANGGPVNIALLAVIFTAQLMRIRAEERVLRETGDYEAYAANVRWRLVPGVY